jgi:hypothetical protein
MSDFDKDRPRRIRAWRSAGLYLPQSKQTAAGKNTTPASHLDEPAADGADGGVVNKLTGAKE